MTANQALDGYLSSLPDEERIELVAQLREFLGVSIHVFCNWRRSRTPIKPVYRREITNFIGKDLFQNVSD